MRSESSLAVGDHVDLEVGAIAHGGHCVARHEGVVIFVRHALPGESITAEITSVGAKFLRADAVEVHRASPDRVAAPCPFSGPGRCGGCDFQHVALPAQRRLKSDVLSEQMRRLAGVDVSVPVEPVPNPRRDGDDGLGWRTRVTFAGAADSRLGLRRHRSHDVEPVTHCPIAADEINAMQIHDESIFTRPWGAGVAVETVTTSTGDVALIVEEGRERHQLTGTTHVHEHVGDHRFRVRADGFWQVHPGAAATLTDVVLEGLELGVGQHVLDLYAGSGLFAAPIAARVGAGGRVDAIEGDKRAVADARRNLAQWEWVHLHEGDVLRALRGSGLRSVDAVVLDPPRTGAGREVVAEIARLMPTRIVYVACDPAALARDVAYLAGDGYQLQALRAFDLFPMTHHLETVATFVPARG